MIKSFFRLNVKKKEPEKERESERITNQIVLRESERKKPK